MKDLIQIRDEITSEVISISYDDVLKYHGNEMRGGVALAFKIISMAFKKFLPEIPKRGECSFYSGIGENGKGIIDTAEMIMRVKTYGKLNLDIKHSLDKIGQEAPNGGKYYFEVGYKNEILKLYLKEGIIPEDFIRYSRISHKCKKDNMEMNKEDFEKLMLIRKNLEISIINSKPEDLISFV